MDFGKILVANRGEIAARVIRTARRLGYRTVAVYSTADAHAPHVAHADEAVLIGPAPAAKSYLSIESIIGAAKSSGAGAIHPGYGFLSENAGFARACEESGIIFIGPPAAAIEIMGNKRRAKIAMERAGVPGVPGYSGPDQSDETLAHEAERIGLPVMVKAAAGGGGRGMRLVSSRTELTDSLRAARAEAKAAFGDEELLLEKAISEPRHIEIQVFADRHGNVVHLGERDCSVQRRHQKVIEESPSPAVDEKLRRDMGEAAVLATRACGYVGAGTVEFLLDLEKRFYFLEMNTRLQVEHPVTEAVTGFDLVEWQILVASGRPLPVAQDAVRFHGHAIEARIYAEDPAHDYRPETGRVLKWRPSDLARVDAGIAEGGDVSPHYDPMIAKIIAHGATRDEARRKLEAALRDTTIFGVTTNKTFLASICAHPLFASGGATTSFLGSHFSGDPSMRADPPEIASFAKAALVVFLTSARGLAEDEGFIGWRSGGPVWVTIRLACRGREVAFRATAEGRGESGRRYAFAPDEGDPVTLEVAALDEDSIALCEGRRQTRLRYLADKDQIWIDDGRSILHCQDVTHRPAARAERAGTGRILAPHDGLLTRFFVEEGGIVSRGQPVLALEAMKMEQRLSADVDGVVSRVHASAGRQVLTGELLLEITPSSEEDDGHPRRQES